MRKWMSITKAFFWLCMAVWPSVAQAQLFFEAEAVFLSRDDDGGSNIVSGLQNVSTNTGSYDTESGYRLRLGWILDNLQIDGAFTQVNPWTGSLEGDFGGNPVSFDAAGVNNLNYEGFLKLASASENDGESLTSGTFEVASRTNYRDAEIMIGNSFINRRWRLAGGFRHIQFDEKSGVLLEGVFTEPTNGLDNAELLAAGATLLSGAGGFADGDDFEYALTTSTTNQLNGFQTTFGVQLLDKEWFTLEGIAKVGIYHNQMSGQITEIAAASGVNDAIYQRVLSGSKTGAAFAGNLGLRAVIGITDYIDLVGGGEVLFLNGLALGGDQYDGVTAALTGANAYSVQNKGSVVAYGGTVGLRIFW